MNRITVTGRPTMRHGYWKTPQNPTLSSTVTGLSKPKRDGYWTTQKPTPEVRVLDAPRPASSSASLPLDPRESVGLTFLIQGDHRLRGLKNRPPQNRLFGRQPSQHPDSAPSPPDWSCNGLCGAMRSDRG